MPSDDNDLRTRFAELRREEDARAPRFTLPSPGGAAPRLRLARRVALALSLAGLVACIFFLRLMRQPERLPAKTAISLTEWKAPTDFLLETPGRDLLRTVPAIGVWQAPGQQPQRPQTRKQLQH
jgi:hypothetical protein